MFILFRRDAVLEAIHTKFLCYYDLISTIEWLVLFYLYFVSSLFLYYYLKVLPHVSVF